MILIDNTKTASSNAKLYNDEKKVYIPILIWNMSERTCWDCIPAPLFEKYYWNTRRSWF